MKQISHIDVTAIKNIAVTAEPSKTKLQTGQESSDRAGLASLSSEAVQIQYKAYGLLLTTVIVYYRATWL